MVATAAADENLMEGGRGSSLHKSVEEIPIIINNI
jgi:hypothetical protein